MARVLITLALALCAQAHPLATPAPEPIAGLAPSPRDPQVTAPATPIEFNPIFGTNSDGKFQAGGTGHAQYNSQLSGNIAGAYESGSAGQDVAGHAAGVAGPFQGTLGGEANPSAYNGCAGGQFNGNGATYCFPDFAPTATPGDISD